MGGGVGVALLPALETRERVVLVAGATDLDQRVLALGRLNARRFRALFPVVRRPRRVAEALLLEELEEWIERTYCVVDAGVAVANLFEALLHRGEREVSRVAI